MPGGEMLALAWAQIQKDSDDLWQLREVQRDVEEVAAALPIEQKAALFTERRVVFEKALKLVGSESASLLFQAAIPVPDFMRLQGIYARLAAAAAADACDGKSSRDAGALLGAACVSPRATDAACALSVNREGALSEVAAGCCSPRGLSRAATADEASRD